jgi:hypothetical protein
VFTMGVLKVLGFASEGVIDRVLAVSYRYGR